MITGEGGGVVGQDGIECGRGIDNGIEIRRAGREDFSALVAGLGQPEFFADRIGRSRHNGGDLLVAFLDGEPVGDVYLWCETLEEPELRAVFPDAPLLNHLEVRPDMRGRGIGARLVRAGEATARERGYDIVVLGVDVDNPDARRLYERLGYLDWGLGPIVARWTEPDGHGGIRFAELTVDTLVASLAAPPVSAWRPWDPRAIAARLPGPDWYVVGGWALELWRETIGRPPLRDHADIEISVPRNAFGTSFPDRDRYVVGYGAIRPLAPGIAPPDDRWQVWVAEDGAYKVDMFLADGVADTWTYPGDHRVGRPLARAAGRTSDGVRFLRPECVLLAKAGGPGRAKDAADFAAIAPDLDASARAWLATALAVAFGDHPWISALR